jgi:hypothetical protein
VTYSNGTYLGINTPVGAAGTIRAQLDIVAFFSDVRLKDNIEYIKDAGAKLYQLNGVYYTQNKEAEKYGYNNYSRQVGLLAQEVQNVLPEVVAIAPFNDCEGINETTEEFLTVKYERIVPLIIETIKEQQREIESLMEQMND